MCRWSERQAKRAPDGVYTRGLLVLRGISLGMRLCHERGLTICMRSFQLPQSLGVLCVSVPRAAPPAPPCPVQAFRRPRSRAAAARPPRLPASVQLEP